MILVNYADRGFVKSQKLNSDSGLLHGFDRVINYTNKNIDNDFYKNNSKILSQTKGAGYWLWKPYIILKTLNCVNENSIIFYCDSGAEFIKNMTPIFEQIQKANRGILIFKLSGHHKEKNYTRKEFIQKIWDLNSLEIYNDLQRHEFKFIYAHKALAFFDQLGTFLIPSTLFLLIIKSISVNYSIQIKKDGLKIFLYFFILLGIAQLLLLISSIIEYDFLPKSVQDFLINQQEFNTKLQQGFISKGISSFIFNTFF